MTNVVVGGWVKSGGALEVVSAANENQNQLKRAIPTYPAVGVKIVVAFSHYAALEQRSSSMDLFRSGLSRTISIGSQFRSCCVQRQGFFFRACS